MADATQKFRPHSELHPTKVCRPYFPTLASKSKWPRFLCPEYWFYPVALVLRHAGFVGKFRDGFSVPNIRPFSMCSNRNFRISVWVRRAAVTSRPQSVHEFRQGASSGSTCRTFKESCVRVTSEVTCIGSFLDIAIVLCDVENRPCLRRV